MIEIFKDGKCKLIICQSVNSGKNFSFCYYAPVKAKRWQKVGGAGMSNLREEEELISDKG